MLAPSLCRYAPRVSPHWQPETRMPGRNCSAFRETRSSVRNQPSPRVLIPWTKRIDAIGVNVSRAQDRGLDTGDYLSVHAVLEVRSSGLGRVSLAPAVLGAEVMPVGGVRLSAGSACWA